MKEYILLKKSIAGISDPFKKKLFFIGYLTELLKKEQLKPVIVGGYAVEFYTAGGYNTLDIDLVFSDNKLLDKYLSMLNFKKMGRSWFNKELDILVEAPGSSLDTDEMKNLSIVSVGKYKVYIIGLEDIIIDRLNAYVYWDSKEDGYWVRELLGLFIKKINWKYLNNKLTDNRLASELKKLIKK